MIERAQADKPPIAQLADRIASRFILAILTVAALVASYWWFQSSEHWLEITLAVLIVTCPCALSLATPAAISAALSRLQGVGLLVKRGHAIEVLDKVTHLVFDKTGTLTLGKPVLSKVFVDESVDRSFCLQIAASLENYSEHPLARALVRATTDAHLPVEKMVNQSGGGLSAFIDDQQFAIGSVDFIEAFARMKVNPDWLYQANKQCATAVGLAQADKILALFILHDEIRPDAADLILSIKADDRKVILMTGDSEATARQVASAIGIEEYYANLKPEQKMARVKALQVDGATVLMVGDGINDAPVLSNADVSIAMGDASALAKTSADIVMLGNRLSSILDGLSVSTRTQLIIKQNLSWALGYNICAIPAAAAGYITPWMAAIGMSLSSLIVVINALRLTSTRPGQN